MFREVLEDEPRRPRPLVLRERVFERPEVEVEEPDVGRVDVLRRAVAADRDELLRDGAMVVVRDVREERRDGDVESRAAPRVFGRACCFCCCS